MKKKIKMNKIIQKAMKNSQIGKMNFKFKWNKYLIKIIHKKGAINMILKYY